MVPALLDRLAAQLQVPHRGYNPSQRTAHPQYRAPRKPTTNRHCSSDLLLEEVLRKIAALSLSCGFILIRLHHQELAGYREKHGRGVRVPVPAIHGRVQTGPLHGTCRKAGRFVPR